MLALTQTIYTNETELQVEQCSEFHMNDGCKNKFMKAITFHLEDERCILVCYEYQPQAASCGRKSMRFKVHKLMNWEIGIDISTLLYIKQKTNKNLLYSTGNSTQYSVMAYMGKESKKRVDICITDSLCCTPETNTTL